MHAHAHLHSVSTALSAARVQLLKLIERTLLTDFRASICFQANWDVKEGEVAKKGVWNLNSLLPSSTHLAFSQLPRAGGRKLQMSQIEIPVNPKPHLL